MQNPDATPSEKLEAAKQAAELQTDNKVMMAMSTTELNYKGVELIASAFLLFADIKATNSAGNEGRQIPLPYIIFILK